MEAPRTRRARAGQEAHGKGSLHEFRRMEAAECCGAGTDLVLESNHASVGGGSEAEELPDQVAAGARKAAIPRNGGDADYLAAPRVPGDSGQGIPAPAGWQAAFARRDRQFPQAVRATAATTATSAEAWPWKGSSGDGSCSSGWTSGRCRGGCNEARPQAQKGSSGTRFGCTASPSGSSFSKDPRPGEGCARSEEGSSGHGD